MSENMRTPAETPCAVCGEASASLYAIPVEIEPKRAEDGALWRQWRKGEIVGYCARHEPKDREP